MSASAEVLPAAIGLLLASAPLVMVTMTLVIKRPGSVVAGFFAGWLVGLGLVSAVVIALADVVHLADRSGPWGGYLKIVVGLALIWLGVRKLRKREKADGEVPKWLAAADQIGASGALGLGFLLAAVNPKNLLLTVAAAATIAEATPKIGEQAVAVVVYMVIGSVAVVAPAAMSLLLGARAEPVLARIDGWITRYNALIVGVVLIALGLVVGINGITSAF